MTIQNNNKTTEDEDREAEEELRQYQRSRSIKQEEDEDERLNRMNEYAQRAAQLMKQQHQNDDDDDDDGGDEEDNHHHTHNNNNNNNNDEYDDSSLVQKDDNEENGEGRQVQFASSSSSSTPSSSSASNSNGSSSSTAASSDYLKRRKRTISLYSGHQPHQPQAAAFNSQNVIRRVSLHKPSPPPPPSSSSSSVSAANELTKNVSTTTTTTREKSGDAHSQDINIESIVDEYGDEDGLNTMEDDFDFDLDDNDDLYDDDYDDNDLMSMIHNHFNPNNNNNNNNNNNSSNHSITSNHNNNNSSTSSLLLSHDINELNHNNNSSSNGQLLGSDSLGPRLVHDSLFTYTFVRPHKFIRTIETQVRMLHPLLQSDEVLSDRMTSQRSKEEHSRFEPFALPLPLPPNCKLYKQSLHYVIPGLESDTSTQLQQSQQLRQQQQHQQLLLQLQQQQQQAAAAASIEQQQQPMVEVNLSESPHSFNNSSGILSTSLNESSLNNGGSNGNIQALTTTGGDKQSQQQQPLQQTGATATAAAASTKDINNSRASQGISAPSSPSSSFSKTNALKKTTTATSSNSSKNNISAALLPPANSALSLIRRMDYPLPRRILPYPRGIKVPIGPSPVISGTNPSITNRMVALTSSASTNVPHHSVQLHQNSMEYVYEDVWSVEKVRPILSKTLLVNSNNAQSSASTATTTTTTTSTTASLGTATNNSQFTTDRSKWQSMVLKRHPLVQEVRERVYPLWRAVSFGHTFDVGTKEVKQSLTDQLILNVILQHLVFEGLKETKSALEQESGHNYKWIDVDQSLLHGILKEAIKKTERLYDLVLCDKIPATELQKQKNIIMKELEEMMAEFGIEIDEDTRAANNKSLNDVNVWEEPHDSGVARNMVVEVDPIRKTEQFQAGSLNVLIQKLTADSIADSNNNVNFTRAFLTTYLSFTTSEQLFDKLVQRFHVPKDNMTEIEHFTKKEAVRGSVLNVLRQWVQFHFSQLNPKLITKMLLFLEDEILEDPALKDEGNQIRAIIFQHRRKEQIMNDLQNIPNVRIYKNGVDDDTLASLDLLQSKIDQSKEMYNAGSRSAKMARMVEDAKSVDIRIKSTPEPKIPKSLFAPGFVILDADEEEIARQLTLVEFELFAQIQPQEFLNQAWNLTKLRYRAMNVIKMRQHYDNVQLWVSSLILTASKGDRKYALKKWIKVCEHLKHLRNFNTMRAVLDALCDQSILRLKNVWAAIKDAEKTYQDLVHFISEHNNYAPYREILKQKPTDPCIPYLGLYLKELINIENNSKNYTKHNHVELINWVKRESIFEIISEIQKFQTKGYSLVRVYQLQKMIEMMPEKLPRETLAKLSIAVENDN